eukprot:7359806-Prymnesium_polylepis.1
MYSVARCSGTDLRGSATYVHKEWGGGTGLHSIRTAQKHTRWVDKNKRPMIQTEAVRVSDTNYARPHRRVHYIIWLGKTRDTIRREELQKVVVHIYVAHRSVIMRQDTDKYPHNKKNTFFC